MRTRQVRLRISKNCHMFPSNKNTASVRDLGFGDKLWEGRFCFILINNGARVESHPDFETDVVLSNASK